MDSKLIDTIRGSDMYTDVDNYISWFETIGHILIFTAVFTWACWGEGEETDEQS